MELDRQILFWLYLGKNKNKWSYLSLGVDDKCLETRLELENKMAAAVRKY